MALQDCLSLNPQGLHACMSGLRMRGSWPELVGVFVHCDSLPHPKTS